MYSGIRWVYCDNNPTFQNSEYMKVLGAGRSAEIVLGRFAVIMADGLTADGARGANDTANAGSGARDILGLVTGIYVSSGGGGLKSVQSLGTTDVGFITYIKNPLDHVYAVYEDGDGGNIDLATKNSVALISGTATQFNADETIAPVIISNDKADSSTAHATAGQHALNIVHNGSILNLRTDHQEIFFRLAAGFVV